MINNIGPRKIETDRLIIRPWEKKDSAFAYKNWACDPAVQIPLAEPVYESKEAVDELIDSYISSFETTGKYRWAIILKETGECIGLIAYFFVDPVNEHGEIEYGIGKEFWGRGLITEATKAVINYGFDNMKLHRVQISYKEYNKASKRVIEKCGLIYEGTFREYYIEEGVFVSRHFYSILSNEYQLITDKGVLQCQ